jgi:LuxR family maltose regulon positive regulatory protein
VQPPAHPSRGWPWPLKILTLGKFAVFAGQKPVALSRKIPRRLFALLKYLAGHGGRPVSEDILAAALWPAQEGHEAAKRLKTAIHRLRRLLGGHDFIRVQGRQVSLDRTRVWVDCWAFEQYAGAVAFGSPEESALVTESLLAIYRGDFLAEEGDEPWVLPIRERLKSLFVNAIQKLAQKSRAARDFEQAIALCTKGIAVDSLAESLYRELMLCYEETDRPAEGISVYRRLEKTLSVLLSIKPTGESKAISERLLGRG